MKKRNQFSSRSPSRVPYRTELIPRHGLCFRFWLRGHPRKAQRRIHGDAVRSGRRSSPRFSLLTVCVYYCSTYYKAVRAHSYPGFFRTPHLTCFNPLSYGSINRLLLAAKLLSELSIRVSPSHSYNACRAGLGWLKRSLCDCHLRIR